LPPPWCSPPRQGPAQGGAIRYGRTSSKPRWSGARFYSETCSRGRNAMAVSGQKHGGERGTPRSQGPRVASRAWAPRPLRILTPANIVTGGGRGKPAPPASGRDPTESHSPGSCCCKLSCLLPRQGGRLQVAEGRHFAANPQRMGFGNRRACTEPAHAGRTHGAVQYQASTGAISPGGRAGVQPMRRDQAAGEWAMRMTGTSRMLAWPTDGPRQCAV